MQQTHSFKGNETTNGHLSNNSNWTWKIRCLNFGKPHLKIQDPPLRQIRFQHCLWCRCWYFWLAWTFKRAFGLFFHCPLFSHPVHDGVLLAPAVVVNDLAVGIEPVKNTKQIFSQATQTTWSKYSQIAPVPFLSFEIWRFSSVPFERGEALDVLIATDFLSRTLLTFKRKTIHTNLQAKRNCRIIVWKSWNQFVGRNPENLQNLLREKRPSASAGKQATNNFWWRFVEKFDKTFSFCNSCVNLFATCYLCAIEVHNLNVRVLRVQALGGLVVAGGHLLAVSAPFATQNNR